MIPASGANCIHFEPSDSGGMCKHFDMRRGFWFFSRQGKCVLTQGDPRVECELRVPKFKTPDVKKIAQRLRQPTMPTPTKIPAPVKKSSGIHKHKKHTHKHKEK